MVRPVLAGALSASLLLAAPVLSAPPAAAADARSEAAADRAVTYLRAQQQPDGRIGTGGGVTETAEAVLAIAEAAQRTLVYDAPAAHAAVSTTRSGAETPLTYLDDVADGSINAGSAARLVFVARSVGLDPRAFDPDGDGAKDLAAEIDADEDGGAYGFFFDTALVATAMPLLGRAVPADTAALLRDAQRSDGGFNFAGDQDTGEFSGSDAEITGVVVQALIAAGESPASTVVRRALGFLASQQNADGGFHSAFSADSDPSSTRSAVLAIAAAGYDPVIACWRAAGGAASPKPYVTADAYLRGAQVESGRVGAEVDFQPTQLTSAAVQALMRSFQPAVRGTRQPCATPGYRLIARDGGVFVAGSLTYEGSMGHKPLNQPVVAAATTPSDASGYWLFAKDGGVFAFGDAPFLGSMGGTPLNAPIVAAAGTPTGGGYVLFAGDGGVFTFGDAPFLGSTAGKPLNAPVVAAAMTPTGRGYWLFAADGGVFTFGDAAFAGSTGSTPLAKPVVAAAASRQGGGYLLFASDGGVFAFGDAAATFAGSLGGQPLNAPIVGGARSDGDGYYLVGADGGVFAFAAPFHGSRGGLPENEPIVAIVV